MKYDLLTSVTIVIWVLLALAFMLAHWCDNLAAGRSGQTVFAHGAWVKN